MKKHGYWLLLLLLAAALMAGCAPEDVPAPPTEPQTAQTEPPTDPPTDPPTAPPTDPPTEAPTEPAEQSRPELAAYFQTLLQWDEDRRYSQALGCVFESPEQAPVYFFFYNGVDYPGSWGSLTEAERTFLLRQGFIDEMDLQIMPAQTLDEMLQRYFGVGLGDVEIPAGWVYSPDSDCCYSNHNDAWGSAAQVTEVRETAEGLIRVFYHTDLVFRSAPEGFDLDTGEWIWDAAMVLTLRPTADGGYQMISNVPAQ